MRPNRPGFSGGPTHWALIGVGVLLPVLTLIPLGSLWLWQNGYLIPWALFAVVTTVVSYLGSRWLASPPASPATLENVPVADADAAAMTPGDPGWTPAEQAAWGKVQAIAAAADPDKLQSREAAVALGLATIEAVARSMKPDRREPLLQFTAPEALALVERVAIRLNGFVRDNVPLADTLTVAQGVTLYRWRGAFDTAQKAYGIWRALRVFNPATAIASEIRERLSRELMVWGREHVARRLARAFVEEVGRAAIDLYGGRLRLDPRSATPRTSAASARDLTAIERAEDRDEGEPLRILAGGQISAGKSSLVNALAAEAKAAVDALPATASQTPYRLTRDGLPAALIIDTPGVQAGQSHDRICAVAADADLIVWVCAANRADREPDRLALAAINTYFAARPDRRRPPLLLVLTHIDLLRPFQDWRPPYDLGNGSSPKAASIRAAVEAVASDLAVPATDIIPACLSDPPGLYNVDVIWARLAEQVPEAERARLVRVLRDVEGRWDLGRMWGQAVRGGRVLVKAAVGR